MWEHMIQAVEESLRGQIDLLSLASVLDNAYDVGEFKDKKLAKEFDELIDELEEVGAVQIYGNLKDNSEIYEILNNVRNFLLTKKEEV